VNGATGSKISTEIRIINIWVTSGLPIWIGRSKQRRLLSWMKKFGNAERWN